jgi:hypothetical protein
MKRILLTGAAGVRLCIAMLCLLLAFSAGAKAAMPGFIHLVKDGKGVWWFEDGQGKRFFSLGVACVDGCYGNSGEDAARHPGVLDLLKRWGFNSEGAWSSPAYWDDLYFAAEIYPTQEPHSFDVFAESGWKDDFLPGLREEVRPFRGKKNLLGYFLSNEPSWDPGVIWDFYAGLDASEPGAAALKDFLKNEWHDQGPVRSASKRYSDLVFSKIQNAWMVKVVSTFYQRYAALVRQLDPDHLLLGLRYVHPDAEEIAVALAPNFDVWSINDYNRYGHIKPEYFDIYRATGKPMLNSEWSFSGYPKPGRRSLQFVDVYSQEAKGYGYRKAIWEAARTPFMVGMHFFLWEDYEKRAIAPEEGEGKARPKGGGEFMGFAPDKNMGLVAEGGKPYQDFGKWCVEANDKAVVLHQAARLSPPVKKEETIKLVEGPGQAVLKPGLEASLYERQAFTHVYGLSHEKDKLVLSADISDSRIDVVDDPEYNWEGDYLDLRLDPLKPADEQKDYHTVFLIFPSGGGTDSRQPYAQKWEGVDTGVKKEVRLERKDKTGGYTLRAEVPLSLIQGFPGASGSKWKLSVGYQNVNEIYQTRWRGTLVIP